MKKLMMTMMALISFNAFAASNLVALNIEKASKSVKAKKVSVTFQIPCGVFKKEIKEVKIYSENENRYYLGLVVPQHTLMREIMCIMQYSPVKHTFKNLKNLNYATEIKIMNKF